jgi:hypothetical protein
MSNPSQPGANDSAHIDTSIKVSHNLAMVFLKKKNIDVEADVAPPYM